MQNRQRSCCTTERSDVHRSCCQQNPELQQGSSANMAMPAAAGTPASSLQLSARVALFSHTAEYPSTAVRDSAVLCGQAVVSAELTTSRGSAIKPQTPAQGHHQAGVPARHELSYAYSTSSSNATLRWQLHGAGMQPIGAAASTATRMPCCKD